MVGSETRAVIAGLHRVGILFAGQPRRAEAVADFDALDRIDAHHPGRQIAVELGIDRCAPSGGHAGGDAFDHRAQRRPRLACLVDQRFPAFRGGRIGAPEGIARDLVGIEIRGVHRIAADFGDIGEDRHLGDYPPRHCARGHAHRGFAGRTAAATAIVAQPVFRIIGVIGMAGAVGVGDLGIILRPLIGVLDQQRNRRAGGGAFEHARQDAHRIGFLALGGELVLPRLARIEEGLDVFLGQCQPRRAPVDHRADRGSMALAPSGEAQRPSECIPAHGASHARNCGRLSILAGPNPS